MLRCSTMSELIVFIAAFFGFGATAVTFHDLATISFYCRATGKMSLICHSDSVTL